MLNYSNEIFYLIVRVPDEPECRIDEDCPSKLTCMRETCQNPCRISNPCTPSQTCAVKDTLPTRTVACLCPEGYVTQNNGQCIKGILLQNVKKFP